MKDHCIPGYRPSCTMYLITSWNKECGKSLLILLITVVLFAKSLLIITAENNVPMVSRSPTYLRLWNILHQTVWRVSSSSSHHLLEVLVSGPAYIRLYVHISGLNLLTLHGPAGHGLNHILNLCKGFYNLSKYTHLLRHVRAFSLVFVGEFFHRLGSGLLKHFSSSTKPSEWKSQAVKYHGQWTRLGGVRWVSAAL